MWRLPLRSTVPYVQRGDMGHGGEAGDKGRACPRAILHDTMVIRQQPENVRPTDCATQPAAATPRGCCMIEAQAGFEVAMPRLDEY